VCFFRLFVDSNREFAVHDVHHELYASLAVLVTPSHSRVPITHDFVDTRMPSPPSWSRLEYYVPLLRYHEDGRSAGLRIRFLEKSHLCGGFGTKFLGYKIQWGVVRGYRVGGWTLRLFPAAFSWVRSHGRMACSFHQILWPRAVILSSPVADEIKHPSRSHESRRREKQTATEKQTQGYPDFSGLYYGSGVLFWRIGPKISARDGRCQISEWLAISYLLAISSTIVSMPFGHEAVY
jgi:hypothetical protein